MKKIQLFSWNVNGLRAACKKGFVNWVKKTKPDIFCLQETKAMKVQLPDELQALDSYYSFFSESKTKKGYSGVATYTKFSPGAINKGMGIKKFDDEGRILETDFGHFILFNVYFPNGGRDKKRVPYKIEFYDAFLKHCDKQKKQGKKIIICGDVNTAHKEIDLFHPKENSDRTGFLPEERVWIDKLIKHGYVDIFRKFNKKPLQYTWWDYKTRARERNVGWRIDYFFVSENVEKNVKSAKIHSKVMGSDHCPISITIEVPNNF
ncbi:exodeoxyribonuclease III [Patescibacteria group bacterium]|nr:exodeoxyribonuclease III [Patescibacteria group bacterium]MBU1673552.1 exodeoxyribonuclease III [Patescibacteria group bacterium]MBU1963630.1 exodeoxyribonuclease III [Patescibacteria group bacterium]